MKHLLNIVFLFFSIPFFSQTQSDKLKQISTSDTVIFMVETSGCFNSGITSYKFIKQKNKERLVIYTLEKASVTKKMSSKKYEAFIKRYKVSANRFKDPDEKQLCTMTTDFELNNRKLNVKFRNGSCQGEFNPEEYLLQLLK